MSLLGKLLKTGFDLITTPIDVAKDVITLGGELVNEDQSAIKTKLEKLQDDGEEIRKEMDKL